MTKKFCIFIFSGLLLSNVYGCLALFAGAAAGTGTAVWLSDKLTQEFNAPYERTITAAETALKTLNLEITKESKQTDVAQLRSKYTDGKDIWIDIHKVTATSSKVDVRVGTVKPDKDAAKKILDTIQKNL